MFETDDSDTLRTFTQQDLLASTIRVSLGLLGPVGPIVGEFLTQFVPRQRIDRLQDFVEKLNDRMSGIEEQFKDRTRTSAGFAALVEQATLSAVRTPSDEHRIDLAEILTRGLTREDAEMLEQQELVALRDQINDVQVVLLMKHGNFRGFKDNLRLLIRGKFRVLRRQPELKAFKKAYPDLFLPNRPESADEWRRFTIMEHYMAELAALGLLEDERIGIVIGSRTHDSPNPYQITPLGRLLLESIGRFRDPFATTGYPRRLR